MTRIFVAVLLMSMAAMAGTDSPSPVTFNKDVLPILQNNCQSCHRPNQIGPMPLLTYQDARPWAAAIKSAVLTKKMPPWFADSRFGHFSNERNLTPAEISTLVRWADSGAVEGYVKDRPVPRAFSPDGWNIKPDLIFPMPKPYEVPPDGVIEYTYIVIPTHFTKDTWVTAAEVLPGNRSVMHHVIAFVRPPGSQWIKDAKPGEPFVPVIHKRDANGAGTGIDPRSPDPQQQRGRDPQQQSIAGNEFLVAYVPGIQPQTFDLAGSSAKLIPAGSDIVLQLHYTTNGKPATDVTKVGLVLAKETPKLRYLTIGASQFQFTIPPNDANYEVHSQVTVEEDNAKLVWLQPHMHLRGKDFEFRLVYPTGESTVALKVPNYSFNWQLGYDEAAPLVLPKGTRIECTAHFDNSPNNPMNPNPNASVKWGDQSWEEMMIGWFGVVVNANADPSKVVKRQARAQAPSGD